MSTTTINPRELTAADVAPAPVLPEVLPPRKARGRVAMFIWRHPTISAGGFLVALIVAIAIFAPWLFPVDPTALSPPRRARAPSGRYWSGTDVLGRAWYSTTLTGALAAPVVRCLV